MSSLTSFLKDGFCDLHFHVKPRVNRRQAIAIVAPPVLIGVMYPVFRVLAAAFSNPTIGWYLGLASYWLVFGAAFPVCLVGLEGLIPLIRPRKPTVKVCLLVLFPLAMASLYRLVPRMGYEKQNAAIWLLCFSTAFGNGFFEEVLWRGVYMKLFPNSLLFRIIWPGIWFALWHYVPGSVSPNGNAIGLMAGAGLFGFYLSFLAKKTGTIWWSMVAHILGGIIMIL